MKNRERMWTKRNLSVCLAVLAGGVLLGGCGNVAGNGVQTEIAVTGVTVVDIFTEGASEEFDVDEHCKVLATYEKYNVQVPVEQLAKDLWKEDYEAICLSDHKVSALEEGENENGKYDVVDTVTLQVTAKDPFDLLPQRIHEKITYKRDAGTLEWLETDRSCSQWDANIKKLGGTAWKHADVEKEVYLRLRDTIEFFYLKNKSVSPNETVEFDTTILGAMAYVEGGEVEMKRIHVLAGTVSANGSITLSVVVEDTETITVELNDYERIEKAELPFTDEEYKAVADAR